MICNDDPASDTDTEEEDENVTLEDLSERLYTMQSTMTIVKDRQLARLQVDQWQPNGGCTWVLIVIVLLLLIRIWIISERSLCGTPTSLFTCHDYLNRSSYP